MFKTDLIMETCEILKETNVDLSKFSGVLMEEYIDNTCTVTKVTITNKEGEQKIGKPIGEYFTVDIRDKEAENIVFCVKNILKHLICEKTNVLVCGVGNRNIISDAIGPLVCDKTVVTRHLLDNKYFNHLNQTSAISTNVLGKTGIETAVILSGVCKEVKPDVIIAIDALAARKIERLCNVIQISNTGLTPGSGVSNSRMGINHQTLGSTVIAVGVPTVITGSTLAYEIDKKANIDLYKDIVITLKEIDTVVLKTSNIISKSINYALNKTLTDEDIEMFLE